MQAAERLARLKETTVLEFSPEALLLAQGLLKHKAIPKKASNDAFHLAIAAFHELNFLLTWNCKHLANAALRPYIEKICKGFGYQCPIVCTPEELLEN